MAAKKVALYTITVYDRGGGDFTAILRKAGSAHMSDIVVSRGGANARERAIAGAATHVPAGKSVRVVTGKQPHSASGARGLRRRDVTAHEREMWETRMRNGR
jgi:hypothetical protein